MNRRTRTLIVVGVAVVLASLASYFVYQAILRIPVREVTVVERQQVVAKDTIPVGVLVTKEQVKLTPWPADNPLPGGFTSIEEVVDRGVLAPFVAGEPIIEGKLAPKASGGGLPPLIPQGMRAMSVRVNEIIGVAGYTTPGTHVDVIVTTRTAQQEAMSRVVLSNIQVLIAGSKYEEDLARKEPVKTTVVTLLVTPPDAERLTLATNEGVITLALRNPLDTVPTETNGVKMNNLLGAPGAPPKTVTVGSRTRVVVPPPPPAPKPYSVEMIEGNKRKMEEIKKEPDGSKGAGSRPENHQEVSHTR